MVKPFTYYVDLFNTLRTKIGDIIINNPANHEQDFIDYVTRLLDGIDGSEWVKVKELVSATIRGSFEKITLKKICASLATNAACKTSSHTAYSRLAARIALVELYDTTETKFSKVVNQLANHTHPVNGRLTARVNDEFKRVVETNSEILDEAINHDIDFECYDYIGIKTLLKSYLIRDAKTGLSYERPQHMIMRVAVAIHEDNITAVLETYRLMSQGFFTHATPTLANAGTINQRMASCYLGVLEDKLSSMYAEFRAFAMGSQGGGGMGVYIGDLRAKEAYIAGSNGQSAGLIPVAKVLQAITQHVDQGGNKRPGAMALYLEPWHPDVESILGAKRHTGTVLAADKTLDMFYGLMIPDEFMKRAYARDQYKKRTKAIKLKAKKTGETPVCPEFDEEEARWYLISPDECPCLSETWGEEFSAVYNEYVEEHKATLKFIDAGKLMKTIVQTQMETGMPYMIYKDAVNSKSNQQHQGTVKCANLCCEITQLSKPGDMATCNLASISLSSFVEEDKFNFAQLNNVVRVVTRNLNNVIDRSDYIEAGNMNKNNLDKRPMGIGLQGLADTFAKLKMPYDSEEALNLNRAIFEVIYYSALRTSCDLAVHDGPYKTYRGSPMSQGRTQPEMWGVELIDNKKRGLYWQKLKADIKEYGVRNCLLVAPMPTASTAQILGNNESTEPFTNNIYLRRVGAGEFQVVNKHLIKDLCALGLWNDDVKNEIIINNGSIQKMNLPRDIKDLYKTVWDLPQSKVVNMAYARSPYIDQSQSMNIHMDSGNIKRRVLKMHYYSWSLGLKTGMYYLRTNPATTGTKVTVDSSAAAAAEEEEAKLICRRDNPESCIMCSG